MVRFQGWIYALGLMLAGSLAAQAMIWIPADQARIAWDPAPGAPAYYGVWVRRNGSPYPDLPDLWTTQETAILWPSRTDQVEQVVMKVAAFDARGRQGPYSEESVHLLFVPPTPEEPVGPVGPVAPEPPAEPVTVPAPPAPPPPPPSAPATSASARPFDLDGDGTTDLLWRFEEQDQIVVWLVQDREPVEGGLLNPRPSQEILGSGDFDADGRADLLFEDLDTGALEMWLMDGLSLRSVAVLATPSGWRVEALGDFDGDGRADLLGNRWGQAEVLFMDGASVRATANLGEAPWSMLWEAPDLDGDGRADVLFHDSSQQTASAWIVDGDRVVATRAAGVPPWYDGLLAGHGDVDGDGDDDILWTRPRSGDLRFFMNDGGNGVPVLSWTNKESEKVEALGDFDGDGRANEVLMRDHDTGENYIAYYDWNGSSGSMPPQRVELPALDPAQWRSANR